MQKRLKTTRKNGSHLTAKTAQTNLPKHTHVRPASSSAVDKQKSTEKIVGVVATIMALALNSGGNGLGMSQSSQKTRTKTQ